MLQVDIIIAEFWFMISWVTACLSSTGSPQGTQFSPFLFTLYTPDFQYIHFQKVPDNSLVASGMDRKKTAGTWSTTSWSGAGRTICSSVWPRLRVVVVDYTRKKPKRDLLPSWVRVLNWLTHADTLMSILTTSCNGRTTPRLCTGKGWADSTFRGSSDHLMFAARYLRSSTSLW